MPQDAGLIRVDEQTGLGVALAVDGNGRYCLLDPYAGTQLALAEAYRNVAAAGARPLAVTNCLNFGSPEDPAVMWQFSDAVRGLADACLALGIPVTGGNVSFYNQTADAAIHPTPVVGVLGVHDDVRTRLSIGFARAGCRVLLLGRSAAELGGSLWAHVVHGHLGGRPPAVDLDAERALAEVLVAGRGLLDAAHDLSDGGLAVAPGRPAVRFLRDNPTHPAAAVRRLRRGQPQVGDAPGPAARARRARRQRRAGGLGRTGLGSRLRRPGPSDQGFHHDHRGAAGPLRRRPVIRWDRL